MKATDIIRITRVKLTGLVTRYSYRVDITGDVSFHEPTRPAAESAALKTVRHCVNAIGKRTYIRAADGVTVFVVYATSGGWSYDIVSKAALDRGYPSSCSMEGGEADVIAAATKHASTYGE